MGLIVYVFYLVIKGILTDAMMLPILILLGVVSYFLLFFKFDKKTFENFKLIYKESRGT